MFLQLALYFTILTSATLTEDDILLARMKLDTKNRRKWPQIAHRLTWSIEKTKRRWAQIEGKLPTAKVGIPAHFFDKMFAPLSFSDEPYKATQSQAMQYLETKFANHPPLTCNKEGSEFQFTYFYEESFLPDWDNFFRNDTNNGFFNSQVRLRRTCVYGRGNSVWF